MRSRQTKKRTVGKPSYRNLSLVTVFDLFVFIGEEVGN